MYANLTENCILPHETNISTKPNLFSFYEGFNSETQSKWWRLFTRRHLVMVSPFPPTFYWRTISRARVLSYRGSEIWGREAVEAVETKCYEWGRTSNLVHVYLFSPNEVSGFAMNAWLPLLCDTCQQWEERKSNSYNILFGECVHTSSLSDFFMPLNLETF